MTNARIKRTYDLGNTGSSGVQLIVNSLQIDRENVAHVGFNQDTRVLEVELTGTEATAHVEAFITNMRRTHRLISRKILLETHARELRIKDIDGALADSPDVQWIGPGLVGLRGTLLALFRFFEREFSLMASQFAAEDTHYPVMLPAEVLAELGYLDNFPQHATFCSHFPDNLPALESFAGELRSSNSSMAEKLERQLVAPSHVLIPGVCLPCYRQQRDLVLAAGAVRTLTMQNHVFRYEGGNFRPLTRGWDFTVRDIVFFGSYNHMLRLRQDVMNCVMAFCRELDLEVTIELANDPFFLDASRDKAIYQRLGEVKYELLFQLPYRGEALAASSFNLHRDFYTSIYNTRLAGGELAESACMGFGLERWLYGFLSQKGLDPAEWPERIRSQLKLG